MEEYYIGMLNLPMFSGPDDTSLIVIGICWFSAFMGSDWWLEIVEVPFGITEYFGFPNSYRRSTYAICIIYVAEVSFVTIGNIKKYWEARNNSHFKERFTIQSFILHGGYMWLNIAIYDIYGVLCGSDILHTHTRSIIFCFSG